MGLNYFPHVLFSFFSTSVTSTFCQESLMSLLPILSSTGWNLLSEFYKMLPLMVWSLFTTPLVSSLSPSLCRLWPHQTFVYSSNVLTFSGFYTSFSWWLSIPAFLLLCSSTITFSERLSQTTLHEVALLLNTCLCHITMSISFMNLLPFGLFSLYLLPWS